jgi:hypothetical protein|uniref:Uncharacterized protein n=1 Tax=viral metagenome TaxID=1070528 RepID=A0A6C0IQC9_9ZZZZ
MWPETTTTNVSNELKQLKKILYVGAWNHIEPTMHHEYKNVSEFIYIDTQPRSEIDGLTFEPDGYKTQFLSEIIEKCRDYGFHLVRKKQLDTHYHNNICNVQQCLLQSNEYPDINPCIYEFKNAYTNKKIKYYISTNIEYNMNAELKKDIETSDGIIVSGYFPSIKLLEYFPKPKALIGYTDTVYPDTQYASSYVDENTKNAIYYVANMRDEHAKKYFHSYYICSYFTTHISKCTNINEIGEKSIMEHDNQQEIMTVDIS